MVSWSEVSGALVLPGPPGLLGAFPALGLARAQLRHLHMPPLSDSLPPVQRAAGPGTSTPHPKNTLLANECQFGLL